MPEEVIPVPEGDHDPHEWHRLAEEAAGWPEDHEGLQQFRQNHVNRVLGEQGLGHLTLSKDEKAGARFLHQNGSVDGKEIDHVVSYLRQHGTKIPDKAADRMGSYIGFMREPVGDGILTGSSESIRQQIDTHVIKAEDVPESHFALQQRIARERGHGTIEITDTMRSQLIEAVQSDQRGSLELWAEYLGGTDGSYPDWFKRYTWDSVLKLGRYDKESGKFDKREDTTVAAYPEINREALAYVYDSVSRYHVLGTHVEDSKLTQLLKEGSFGRLYAHAVLEITSDSPELKQDVRGSWTKFNQTDDPRTARRLSGSLRGHGTEWCTAGESTAAFQLETGDFYVFYTRDEDGKDTIPRVAIRMEDDEVAEVRGVNPSQELEPVMADIASEKLAELPGGELYIKRADDMKRLTALDARIREHEMVDLSVEDLRFLYELDGRIIGFGYEDDPRIEELHSLRDIRKDLALVLNCSEEQVSLTGEEAMVGTPEKPVVCHYGGLVISNRLLAENGYLPHYVIGDLLMMDIDARHEVQYPEHVQGDLYISGLETAYGVTFPRYVGGSLELSHLERIQDCTLPEHIGEDIDMASLFYAKGATFPSHVYGNVKLGRLSKAQDIVFPKKVDGYLDLSDLTSVESITLPEEIGTDLYLNGVSHMKNVVLPKLKGIFRLSSLTAAEQVVFPQFVNSFIDLGRLSHATDVTFPEEVRGSMYLDSLAVVKNVTLPKIIHGGLSMDALKNLDGLELPGVITSSLSLIGLTELRDITLPNSLKGNIYMEQVVYAQNVVFPETAENLTLNALQHANNLTFPKNIEGSLNVANLVSAEGITFPERIELSLYLDSLATLDGFTSIPDVARVWIPRKLDTEMRALLKRFGREYATVAYSD